MKTALAMAGLCAALAVASFVAYHIGGANMATEVQAAFSGAQEAYLSQRFELAYTRQSPSIAVWEGTNLVAYLERDGIPAAARSKEDRASRAFLNARLSALFGELGDTNRAQRFAGEAAVWIKTISTNADVSDQTVVERIIARDSLKRQWR